MAYAEHVYMVLSSVHSTADTHGHLVSQKEQTWLGEDGHGGLMPLVPGG